MKELVRMDMNVMLQLELRLSAQWGHTVQKARHLLIWHPLEDVSKMKQVSGMRNCAMLERFVPLTLNLQQMPLQDPTQLLDQQQTLMYVLMAMIAHQGQGDHMKRFVYQENGLMVQVDASSQNVSKEKPATKA